MIARTTAQGTDHEKDVLHFTGVKLIGKHYFGSVVLSDEKKREQWLDKAFHIGGKNGRAPGPAQDKHPDEGPGPNA